MFSWLPKRVKSRMKGCYKGLRADYVRRRYAFTSHELIASLRRVGVKPGDVLLVHSSFDEFQGFAGNPTDVILALQEAVGCSGTLLMPTSPFTGTAVDYVSTHPVFDVSKTPSRMGLITELFRRSPGVMRSVHPTHAVAAWGANAAGIIKDHHLADTPCGRHTPYGRLLDFDGKILFLGTDIDVMTFFHCMEEELESRMPFSPFTTQVFSATSRDANGEIVRSAMRLFEPAYSRRRNLGKLVPVLKSCGYWNEGSVGRVGVILLNAHDVRKACHMLADRGDFCYGR